MNDTWLDFVTGSVIGVIVWLFGGLDTSLKVLVAFSVIDYVSGVSAAWTKGIVSSRMGFQGIIKKIIMFLLVAVANLIDKLLPGGSDAVRTVVILAFVSNEGISIMENANRIGVPFPKALQNYFEQLRDKDPSPQAGGTSPQAGGTDDTKGGDIHGDDYQHAQEHKQHDTAFGGQ